MLLHQNAFGEGVLIVGGENGNGLLQDNGAVIEVLVHKVNGAAAELDAVIEGLLLRFEAGKSGQQRGMDVQDSLGKLLHEPGREQTEVSGEDDEIDASLAQGLDDSAVMLFALASLAGEDEGGDVAGAGSGDGSRVLTVADDDGDMRAEFAGGNVVGDGEKVGAASGEKYAKSSHRSSRI